MANPGRRIAGMIGGRHDATTTAARSASRALGLGLVLLLLRRIEDQAELDGAVAVLAADGVDGRLGRGTFRRVAVDEVGGIGKPRVGELGNADAEQPVLRAVRFAGEELAAGR